MVKIGRILEFLEKKGYEFEYYGCRDIEVRGFSSLSKYKQNTITWVKKLENWRDDIDNILLAVTENDLELPIENVIRCKNSKAIFIYMIQKETPL